MSKLPIEKHIEFYNIQLQEMYEERMSYIKTPIRDLWKEGRLFFGRIWGYDEKRGQIILRFKKDINKRIRLPRLKVPYQLCIVGAQAPSSPNDFKFSYETFRQDYSSINSRCIPTYFLPSKDDWRFQGCDQVSMEFLSIIKDILDQGKHPLIILAEEDPPYRYLQNLKDYVKSNASNLVLNLETDLSNINWNPHSLPPHDTLLDHTVNLISNNKNIVIQGPPGTGKTHLIAGICSHFLDKNKSICVTALTNKALVEICEKEPLKKHMSYGNVVKTNLTTDEKKEYASLKEAKDSIPHAKRLLLSSYYKLSDELHDIENKAEKFDILIIEEASQTYLATIAGFIELGKKVLIIGDPMQMFPIVKNENRIKQIHPKIELAIRGLETYTYSNENISYRIIDTYRLTKDAVKQTGLFYDNQLNSVSDLNGKTNITTTSRVVPTNGETNFLLHPLSSDAEDLIIDAVNIATEIHKKNKNFDIAILSNRKSTVEDIYDKIFEKQKSLDGFTIETIDRIQGLTCDICIIVVESSTRFAFQLNRFNVATSRSKRGTIFITRKTINSLMGIDGRVKKFIENSQIFYS